MSTLAVFLVVAGGSALASSAALATPGQGNSAATTAVAFGDSCTDFAAHSSKDISHVEIHYRDGSVVKNESVDSQRFSLDGVAGDEIGLAIVKSGTTANAFECESGPQAVRCRRPEQHQLRLYDCFPSGVDLRSRRVLIKALVVVLR